MSIILIESCENSDIINDDDLKNSSDLDYGKKSYKSIWTNLNV